MRTEHWTYHRMNIGGGVRLAVCLMLAVAAGCAHIPENPDKTVDYCLPPATEGMLVEAAEDVLHQADEDASAFMLIPRNDDALRWRLALIDSAQKSIDLQVFIWTNDESGRLIFERLRLATERGVQVRILVDDLPKDWTDRGTALVARSPNVQIRRFNPGRVRKGLVRRAFQMSTQFQQLNRRMHNKQLIVDGTWGLVGGRNIGNPYFGLSKKYNNRDLDLLVAGGVISDMMEDFDEYWNAEASYPGEAMYGEISEKKAEKMWTGYQRAIEKDQELLKHTVIPIIPLDWSGVFAALPEQMIIGSARSLRDEPVVKGDRGIRLVEQIDELGIELSHHSDIITPYMIPTKEQIENIRKATEDEGRAVRLLVPSMESNNHTMAHSHYKKYRKKLLRAGTELYEFQGWPSAELRAASDTAPIKAKFISLHTKAFTLDDRWVLLGSLNIDPRSIEINTEHMLVIDSPELARALRADFETMVAPENAWAVTLSEKGKLRWTSDTETRKRQPARSFGQRFTDFFWRLMPVERQL